MSDFVFENIGDCSAFIFRFWLYNFLLELFHVIIMYLISAFEIKL